MLIGRNSILHPAMGNQRAPPWLHEVETRVHEETKNEAPGVPFDQQT